MSGLGLGLRFSTLYASLFGGSLEMVGVPDEGVQVAVHIPRAGDTRENPSRVSFARLQRFEP